MYLAVDLLCDLFSEVLLALFQALALHHTHEAGALDFRAQRLSHIVDVGLYILVVLGLYELLVYQAVLLVELPSLPAAIFSSTCSGLLAILGSSFNCAERMPFSCSITSAGTEASSR